MHSDRAGLVADDPTDVGLDEEQHGEHGRADDQVASGSQLDYRDDRGGQRQDEEDPRSPVMNAYLGLHASLRRPRHALITELGRPRANSNRPPVPRLAVPLATSLIVVAMWPEPTAISPKLRLTSDALRSAPPRSCEVAASANISTRYDRSRSTASMLPSPCP